MKVVADLIQVLIVDDQEAFRSAARLVVELADGFDVAGEVGTGEDAIRVAAEIRPNLVLMDIHLPGIDGLEATRQILESNPEIRIIALSTYDEFEERAVAAGAVAFVSKSDFDPSVLSRAWRESA